MHDQHSLDKCLKQVIQEAEQKYLRKNPKLQQQINMTTQEALDIITLNEGEEELEELEEINMINVRSAFKDFARYCGKDSRILAIEMCGGANRQQLLELVRRQIEQEEKEVQAMI